MANFRITIEYDGAAYHGWQRQKNERTVQAEIEGIVSMMVQTPTTVTGSGRTDAGVHALGQVANFKCDASITAEEFQHALNRMLDDDIIIKDCVEVSDRFHARYDAAGKKYRYRILNRSLGSAMEHRYAWRVSRPLDIGAMAEAARHILGEHDFRAFEGAGSPRSNSIRRVSGTSLYKDENGLLIFEIEADGFLRYMVRNIVGTLVHTGLGKITPGRFKEILNSKDRSQAAPTAPPHGLFLIEVYY